MLTTSRTSLRETLNQLLAKGIVFAAYRIPGQEGVRIVAQRSAHLQILPDLEQLEQAKGFLMFPFNKQGDHPNICIAPDVVVDDQNLERLNSLKGHDSVVQDIRPAIGQSAAKQDFATGFEKVMEVIRSGDIEKAILSRRMDVALPDNFDYGLCLEKLLNTYPNAHVYLVNLGVEGIWMGASPETLVELKEDVLHTVSLAGTKPVAAGAAQWTEKELHEQGLVTSYIIQSLSRHGAKVHDMDGPKTVQAGPVWHLKTKFTAPRESVDNIGRFLNDLHPTPAVCGLPKADAMVEILRIEKHDRQYYCGLAGPWNLEETKLFVNLRCMRMTRSIAEIFVGVGITADSDLDDEWQETQAKAQTLLSVVEKM